MYKKITHNIVEEHFAHPMASEIKQMSERSHMLSQTENEPTYKIRMESKQYLNDFAWRLRSYIVNALDGGLELPILEEHLNITLADLGRIVSMFYGATASEKFGMHMSGIMNGVFAAAKAAKANQSLTAIKTTILNHISELSQFLGAANPTAWPATGVSDILTRAVNAIVAQIEARQKKDWAADQKAATLTNDILVSGSMGMPSFADVFARGLTRPMSQKFS